ncbi:CAP domain-containing protein [Saccharibacillus sp. JS10]|uniref:CAP domain-containing protein n=1 Tax=Saccharibacillus sp. JS10 TaxID=2950552 RepID=UPI00352183AA
MNLFQSNFTERKQQPIRKSSVQWKKKVGTFALASILAVGGVYSVAPTDHSYAQTSYEAAYAKVTTDKSKFTAKVVYLVNSERRKAGLKPLNIHAATAKASRLKAIDMSKKNYFDHTSPTYGSPFNLLKLQKVSYRTAGENIAQGQRSPEKVMQDWMNSEGHRKNILNPNFTSIGVAYYNGYWVQLFIG